MASSIPQDTPEELSAIQIKITDPEVQAYLQRYPFACGPSADLNESGMRLLVAGTSLRPPGALVQTILLKAEQTDLPATEREHVAALLEQIGIGEGKAQTHLDDFGWEVNLVPRGAENVLVVGCGDGIELIFLRAVLPKAVITAVDYKEKLLPHLRDATDVIFIEGDIAQLVHGLDRKYDLIFSNHTMEHLYEPDQMLCNLARLLTRGGHILSTMPMVGVKGTPFLTDIHKFLARRAVNPAAGIHPLEIVYLDPGHPWKTNSSDLAGTLLRAGFTDVTLYQRENHRSRPLRLTPKAYRWRRGFLTSLNRLFIGIPRRALMIAFPRKVPKKLPKLFFAAERRLPFGTNYVMNLFSEEALFLARKD